MSKKKKKITRTTSQTAMSSIIKHAPKTKKAKGKMGLGKHRKSGKNNRNKSGTMAMCRDMNNEIKKNEEMKRLKSSIRKEDIIFC